MDGCVARLKPSAKRRERRASSGAANSPAEACYLRAADDGVRQSLETPPLAQPRRNARAVDPLDHS